MTTRLSSRARLLPTVNRWFAHPYLVCPVTFGLYAQHAHLATIESFLDDPEQHRQAMRTPELRGGPFIDYPGEVVDIRAFRDQSLASCAVPLRYGEAIAALYRMLQSEAKGGGLQGLYNRIDPLIRHMVEIFYDVCKQPRARFLERLFYNSPAYDTSLQTCRVEPVSAEPRPFALSTPQLRHYPGSVNLRLPFADPLWDRLCGGSGDDTTLVAALLAHAEPSPEAAKHLLALLTEERLPRRAPPQGVSVRYFGHACVLIEGAGISILIDPLISYAGESTLEHYTFDDLPERIDYVLITHPHQDHVVLETLLRIRHRVGTVVVGRSGGGDLPDVSLKLFFERVGFGCVVELGDYEELAIPGGRVVGVPFFGEHADLDIRGKLVHVVELAGKICMLFADSRPPEPEMYEPVRRMFPKVDCMFLGMECVGAPATWFYGPLLQKMLTRGEDRTRRLDGCDFDLARALQKFLRPERLFIYAMGAEPWITHITSILYSEDLPQFQAARKLEAAGRDEGFHAELLFGMREVAL